MRTSLTALAILMIALSLTTRAYAQKYGGILKAYISANPPSLSLHDESTTLTSFPMSPVFNNLVYYDPFKRQESFDTIIPELAESWSWSADNTVLSFKLRQGVVFHDGKPFSSKDVKATFDIVRGASTKRLKVNPRKLWYGNVAQIAINGDSQVAFMLKRPQPSLLAMLATGYSGVFPAHIPPAEWRVRAVGTGPFSLKEFARDRSVTLEKNQNYWVKERPYLDGIIYYVVPSRASRLAAFASKQIDADSPLDTTKPEMDAFNRAAPGMSFEATPRSSSMIVVFNTKKPPFNDARLRQVVSLALDRIAYAKAVFDGGNIPAGVNLPPPYGIWGLPAERLSNLPGYGDPAQSIAKARVIMASLGYSAENQLRTEQTVRAINLNMTAATFISGALKEVWIDAPLRPLESGVFYGALARRDFTLVGHATGVAADDPDVNFYENYSCGSQRNYSDYCVPEVQQMVDQQSQIMDFGERLQLVRQIDERIVMDVARVIFGARVYYNAQWPYVKNLIPHQTLYNYSRMQEVWLDR